jgi:RNA polymerase sigma-70 factor (ECF subfamily)
VEASVVTDLSDRQLVDAVVTGDAQAFRILVERESRAVIGTCRRVLGDQAEAEDVAQEAFMTAYRSMATFRGDGSFGAWISRIAIRLAVARSASRREVFPMDPTSPEGQEPWVAMENDPEARSLDEESRRNVQTAIAALPANQRVVVALRFYRDFTMDEIARATGAPVGTVKSRLHRALVSLRKQYTSRSAS